MRMKKVTINDADYLVCDNGNVYGKKGLISQRPSTDGYASFTAGRKGNRTRICTHRLVAELFVDNPNGYPEVDHLDADRMNPSSDNLEWVEHSENIRRAYERGNYSGRMTGTNNPKAKLNESMVRNLREKYDNGYTIRELHRMYGIPESTVGNVVHRYTWPNVV